MLRLFYAPGACSLASHIALEETGLEFEPVRMDLTTGVQLKPDYLKLNPLGRVPVLVTDRGPLTENPVILSYIAGLKPELGLLPADAFERACVQARMAWLSSHLHVSVAHVWRPRRFTDDQAADAGMKAKSLEIVSKGLGELDELVRGKEWAAGQFSVLDPYLLVFRRWGARLELPMEKYPALLAHADRVAARPAAARVIAREGIRIDA
ncbi:MAG: glutathione S-transferase family protein [Hyphomonadaceae bacterium]